METRPKCPDHPTHKAWFDGTYGKHGHKRQRYKWVAPDGSKHYVAEKLPRQHPPECLECEHTFLQHEGPQSARTYAFTAREIAWALQQVGKGASYRETAFAIRRRAERFPETPAGWRRYRG